MQKTEVEVQIDEVETENCFPIVRRGETRTVPYWDQHSDSPDLVGSKVDDPKKEIFGFSGFENKKINGVLDTNFEKGPAGGYESLVRSIKEMALPISLAMPIGLLFFLKMSFDFSLLRMMSLYLFVFVACFSYGVVWLLSLFFSHYGVQVLIVLLSYFLLRFEQLERFSYYRNISKNWKVGRGK